MRLFNLDSKCIVEADSYLNVYIRLDIQADSSGCIDTYFNRFRTSGYINELRAVNDSFARYLNNGE